MFVKSKFMHAMYTHAEITSRSLKKSLESAKLKIISSIHRPRDTAFEESCRAKDKVALRNTQRCKRRPRKHAGCRILAFAVSDGGRRKDLAPLASATRIHSLFACTTSIKLPSLVRMLCASVPLTDLAFKKQSFPLDFSTR